LLEATRRVMETLFHLLGMKTIERIWFYIQLIRFS
jgi:hypothetical protein